MFAGEDIYKSLNVSLAFKEYEIVDFLGAETCKVRILKPNSEFLGYGDVKLNKFVLKDDKGYYSFATRHQNLKMGQKVKIRYLNGDFEIEEVGM